jgi:lecithin:cholesterol acyltransferase
MPEPSHVLVGVHGLSRKPEPDQHKRDWIEAIREGLRRNFALDVTADRLAFDLVYWADWLGRKPYGPGEDTEPYVAAAGSGPLPQYRQRWSDTLLREGLDQIGDPLDWAKSAQSIEWVRRHTGVDDIGFALLQARLVDLGTYYADADKRARLRKQLADTLVRHDGKRIMLVAHSMGSIVAYDVLRDLGRTHPDMTISHFVTLGSPLGMPYVLDRIRHENASVRTPSMVRRWSNLADRHDPVAIDVHLADDFEPNDRRVVVEDALILNGYEWPARKHNPHKIYGYLRTPEFSDLVRNFI